MMNFTTSYLHMHVIWVYVLINYVTFLCVWFYPQLDKELSLKDQGILEENAVLKLQIKG